MVVHIVSHVRIPNPMSNSRTNFAPQFRFHIFHAHNDKKFLHIPTSTITFRLKIDTESNSFARNPCCDWTERNAPGDGGKCRDRNSIADAFLLMF